MSFKDIIYSGKDIILASDISSTKLLIVLASACIFGLFVFFVYRNIINNEFYSKDFNRSLAIMTVITAAIVLTIQSNLVISMGMVGALSIVRFRTAIKSSLDLMFLFWSISLGIICGAGLFEIALVLCIVVFVLLLVLGKIEAPVALGLLVIECTDIDDANKAIEEIKPLTSFIRLKIKQFPVKMLKLFWNIRLKTRNLIRNYLKSL